MIKLEISKPVWLIGTSLLADEYVKVLKKMGVDVIVIGRSEAGSKAFYNRTGIVAYFGGLEKFISENPKLPVNAINAVDVLGLLETSKLLIDYGVKNILVEKPGAVNLAQVTELNSYAHAHNASVWVAYNRRFFKSVMEAKELIKKDGGGLYCRFDFTEASDEIQELKTAKSIKERWLYGNSTHVIDTVFHLIGRPCDATIDVAGANKLSWHPSGAIFRGFGKSITGCEFSYHSDWQVPGRWSIEVATKNFKLSFCPMEELQVMRRGSFSWEKSVENLSRVDKCKPGFFEQVYRFLNNDISQLCSTEEHLENFKFYKKIANYDD
ncbi:hypothetical protein OAB82_04240 [Amylibacter sp.]|nr:hypothetical protein [Amylibacter sp.]